MSNWFNDSVQKMYGYNNKNPLTTRKGFLQADLDSFMKSGNELSTANSAAGGASFDGSKPKQVVRFMKKKADPKSHGLNTTFSQKDLDSVVQSFAKRRQEVFGRKAAPGISQTRFL